MSENIQSGSKNKVCSTLIGPVLFFLVAAVGLFFVKWDPYYAKAFIAAAQHSIGASIITGKAASAPIPSWQAAVGYAADYFNAVWKAVILGLLLGSLVQVLIPRNWVRRVLGGTGFGSTAAAGIAAMPGMMCSCCTAPVAVGLRQRSASINAALAFFLANPVLNPATIIFMGFVLSWKFAIFRIVMGLIMVFGIATMASRIAPEANNVSAVPAMACTVQDYEDRLFIRWLKALWQLILDTIPAYLIVVLLLGSARAWLFPAVGPESSDSLLLIIGLAISGTLFVIPTAAEIPIIQTLMNFGLGTGSAAALLMTLPAVSLPSLLIIKNSFPAKVLVFVTVSVIVIGIVSGLLAGLVL